MEKNPIIEKRYYRLFVKNASPISVGNGVSEYSDSDIFRNRSGEIIIPGTSLAGAIRSALDKEENLKSSLFGFSEKNDGRMSSLIISDLCFDGKGLTSGSVMLRDGVQLDESRDVGNKFDYQVLDTGAEGYFDIEWTVREKDHLGSGEDKQPDDIMKSIADRIQSGEIRFGAKKNRGLGKLEVTRISSSTFNRANAGEWLAFLQNPEREYKNPDILQMKNPDGNENENPEDSDYRKESKDYITIKVPLKLDGGIIIRKYSTRPGESDYEHVTANGRPVIPGSSWCGAIRSDMNRILKEVNVSNEQRTRLLEDWLGRADEHDPKLSRQSLLVIEESVITGSVKMDVTRNCIDRVSAATLTGSLYTETSYFGGETELTMLVRKKGDYLSLIGMLQLVIEDICLGFLPVGGEVSIGRGIFTSNVIPDIAGCDTESGESSSKLYDHIRRPVK